MTTPLLTWCIIIGVLMIVLVAHVIDFYIHHQSKKHIHRFIEIGTEREEIYLPGDPDAKTADLNDDYDE